MHETELRLIEALTANADADQAAAIAFAALVRLGQLDAPGAATLAAHLSAAEQLSPELFARSLAGIGLAAGAASRVFAPA